MVHYGKHIIDPATGLCEICDRGAIHEIRQGKRPHQQYLYSNQNGRFAYRTQHISPTDDQPSARTIRKIVYSEPPPVRTRRVIQRQPIRREHTPEEESPRRRRPSQFYYVDDEGQMSARNEPPPEVRKRYVVQERPPPPPPPPRQARVVRRRARTPSPPASRRVRPVVHEHNSDTEITRPVQYEHEHHRRHPEMYYIESKHNNYHPSPVPTQTTHDHHTPPPRIVRKQRKPEPVEHIRYEEPEQPVPRRVYKKLPPGRHEPHDVERPIPNGTQSRPVRKVEHLYPSPRPHESSPPRRTNDQYFDQSSSPYKNPSIYYIRSVD